ncbi:HAD family hydrolase [Tepidiforma sp.]|uniref:HAD family hydrolase n=1 Tax=Tepidiforma sp. TaxID=2682230 RepID=UPI002ADD4EAB|nr:haloacid dehalogenase-like hydrolase [Tepidiforma sp.]
MRPLVLFDIDLTLISASGAGRAAIDAAARECFGVPEATAGIPFDGRTDRAIFTELLDRHGRPRAEFDALAAAYLRALPGALEARGAVALPGVQPLLAALEAAGAILGLATGNLREGARLKLSAVGLWHAFAGGGFGDRHIERRRVVAQALAALDPVPSTPAVVIGDTPADVSAAHAVGLPAIAVATGRSSPADLRAAGADAVLASFEDVPGALSAIRDLARPPVPSTPPR